MCIFTVAHPIALFNTNEYCNQLTHYIQEEQRLHVLATLITHQQASLCKYNKGYILQMYFSFEIPTFTSSNMYRRENTECLKSITLSLQNIL
jgi:hypothetical protein